MSNEIKLNINTILDTSKNWKDVLFEGLDLNTDSHIYVNAFHSRRIMDFLKETECSKIKTSQLDLATLLVLLKWRNCKIEIPNYEKVSDSDRIHTEEVDSGKNIGGKIISLKSNQDTFNFSVTIMDEKYIDVSRSNMFCPRTYSITDYNGDFHNNWNEFNFNITENERQLLSKCFDYDGNISCTKFVQTSLAQSFFTSYYRNMKVLIDRLVAERSYLNGIRKKHISNLLKDSNKDGVEKLTESIKHDESIKEQFESVSVLCFQSKISNSPEFTFDYIDESKMSSREIVDMCDKLLKDIVDITGEFKYVCRLIELAFTKLNPYKENLKPTELSNYNRLDCKWNEQMVKVAKGRILWYELMFADYSILCRYYYKTIKIKK